MGAFTGILLVLDYNCCKSQQGILGLQCILLIKLNTLSLSSTNRAPKSTEHRNYRAPQSTARRLARSGSTSTGHRCYDHSQTTKERTNQKVSTGPSDLQWTNNCSSEGIGGRNVNASEGLIIVSSLVLNGTHHQYHGYLGEQWECDEMVLMMWLE